MVRRTRYPARTYSLLVCSRGKQKGDKGTLRNNVGELDPDQATKVTGKTKNGGEKEGERAEVAERGQRG